MHAQEDRRPVTDPTPRIVAHSLTEEVRAFAFGLPDAWEDHPWGESVAKVGKKVFVFFGVLETDDGLRFTAKLRDSHDEAMTFEWVEPAGYGLDRGGWVTCVAPDDTPVDMIIGWIEESYRLVAPTRLMAQLDQARQTCAQGGRFGHSAAEIPRGGKRGHAGGQSGG